LNSEHPNFVVQKSRQLGLSELGVIKLLHFADTHSYDAVKALFAFPTNDQMDDFVKTRLDTVLSSDYYQSILDPEVDSMKRKKIRDSFIYFRSSSKPSQMEGVDIDLLSLDEYDRVPPLSEESALNSIESSKYKIINRWSTPTLPDVGVNRLFKQSDQNHYLHKCERCNHWNQMNYEEYNSDSIEAGGNILTVNPEGVDLLSKTVVDGSFQFVCQKCGKPLDRWNNGMWVPKYPERVKNGQGTKGFSITSLNAVWKSADDLKRQEISSRSKQSFYNYVLGIPFLDQKLMVQDEDIYSHVHESVQPIQDRGDYKFISVGIDWGNTHYISIYGMVENGRIDLLNLIPIQKPSATDSTNVGADIKQIQVALRPYDPDIIVADIGDSGDKIAKLMQIYGENKVFGCQYNSSPRSTGKLNASWSEHNNTVKVDKLMQNKRFISMLKEGDIHHYRNQDEKHLQMYVDHWKNVTIRDEEDERTGEFYQVISRKGPDHFSQSSVYAMLGWERLIEIFYGDDGYEFNADFISLSQEPTQTDIQNIFG